MEAVSISNLVKNGLQRFQERRRAERIAGSSVVAFYWDGAAPLPHQVRDVSPVGMYVTTEERWYLGTLLHLTVDVRAGSGEDSAVESMTVWSKVIRHGTDGVGFEFVLLKSKERQKMAHLVKTAKTCCEKRND